MNRLAAFGGVAMLVATLGFRCPGATPTGASEPGEGGFGEGGVSTATGGAGGVGGFGGADVDVASSSAVSSTSSGPTMSPCDAACEGSFCADCVDFCLNNASACTDLTAEDAAGCLLLNQCDALEATACIDQRCSIFDTCDEVCGILGQLPASMMCNSSFTPGQCQTDCLTALDGCMTMDGLAGVKSCAQQVTCTGPTSMCAVECLMNDVDVSQWGLPP